MGILRGLRKILYERDQVRVLEYDVEYDRWLID